jgi:lactoylglutathione lyase
MRVNYAIVFVSDMGRSIAFYRDVVGLPLKFETPEWTEFASGGATLALHAARTVGAAEAQPVAGRCRPGLSVDNLDAFHQRMMEYRVPCLQAPKDVFGTRVAQYADPDGLPFSVAEAAV